MVSTKAVKDRGERTALMEPLILSKGSRHRVELNDLALELAQRSAGLRRSLPPTANCFQPTCSESKIRTHTSARRSSPANCVTAK